MFDLRSISYPKANPSLLAANKEKILEEATFAAISGANFIHIDVMDGVFVPNVSFGIDVPRDLVDPKVGHPFLKDTHLMVNNPKDVVSSFAKVSDIVTFHIEASENKEEILRCRDLIREKGSNAGLAINPNTPLENIFEYLEEFDLILLMTVMPGKGGQPFDPNGYDRIRLLKKELVKLTNPPILEIDGGVNDKTYQEAISSGAELLVAGSYLYGHPDFKERLEKIEGE